MQSYSEMFESMEKKVLEAGVPEDWLLFLYKKSYDWCLLRVQSDLVIVFERDFEFASVFAPGLRVAGRVAELLEAAKNACVTPMGDSVASGVLRVLLMAEAKTFPCGIQENGLKADQVLQVLKSMGMEAIERAVPVPVSKESNETMAVAVYAGPGVQLLCEKFRTDRWSLDLVIEGSEAILRVENPEEGRKLLRALKA